MFPVIFKKIVQIFQALLTRQLVLYCDGIPHTLRNLPLKKICNWMRVELSIRLKTVRPGGFPTHLLIEPTNHCQLSCQLCPVSRKLNREEGHMSMDLFEKIIRETGPYASMVLLWDWGEPFLNPRIFEMIAHAKMKNLAVISSTNGHLFSDMDQAEKLVQSGIDTIIFAVDGITQETYAHFRRGGTLQTVLSGIKNVVQARQNLNTSTPLINFRFMVMQHNEHEVPQLESFTRSLGVDVLSLRTLNPFYNIRGKKGDIRPPLNPQYRRFTPDPKNGKPTRRKQNPCKTLWNMPAIHWDGTVCPCTFDPDEDYPLGNVARQSFQEIWFGAPYQQVRNTFRKDYTDMTLCTDCSYAFEGGTCNSEVIVKTFFFSHRTHNE